MDSASGPFSRFLAYLSQPTDMPRAWDGVDCITNPNQPDRVWALAEWHSLYAVLPISHTALEAVLAGIGTGASAQTANLPRK